MASPGAGTAPHVFGELFNMMTGVDLVHIPYRSNYYPDLLSGQVQVIFAAVTSSIGYIKAGQLRAIGVTTATHVEALPDVLRGKWMAWYRCAQQNIYRDHRKAQQRD
jgi:tripartite-type tricarboxylate transporter receptor subunit TctC